MSLDEKEKRPAAEYHCTNNSLLHGFLVITYELVMQLIFALPRYRICNWIKATFLRLQGAKIGRRVIFCPGVCIMPGRNLIIGDDVLLALGVIVGATAKVTIGPRAMIGFRTQILAGNHVIPKSRERMHGAGMVRTPICIEKDTWIGANCLILAGVTIGEGAVVAGGSVVTKSVEPFTIVGGNPAKLIRRRDDLGEPIEDLDANSK